MYSFVESLIESALSAGVIEILKDYVVKFSADEDVMLMVLLAVGSLADSGDVLHIIVTCYCSVYCCESVLSSGTCFSGVHHLECVALNVDNNFCRVVGSELYRLLCSGKPF